MSSFEDVPPRMPHLEYTEDALNVIYPSLQIPQDVELDDISELEKEPLKTRAW